ncbi:MAG: hypothetical protein ACJA2J_001425, partial [Candidatus Azotimanducaceae bacterium]
MQSTVRPNNGMARHMPATPQTIESFLHNKLLFWTLSFQVMGSTPARYPCTNHQRINMLNLTRSRHNFYRSTVRARIKLRRQFITAFFTKKCVQHVIRYCSEGPNKCEYHPVLFVCSWGVIFVKLCATQALSLLPAHAGLYVAHHRD